MILTKNTSNLVREKEIQKVHCGFQRYQNTKRKKKPGRPRKIRVDAIVHTSNHQERVQETVNTIQDIQRTQILPSRTLQQNADDIEVEVNQNVPTTSHQIEDNVQVNGQDQGTWNRVPSSGVNPNFPDVGRKSMFDNSQARARNFMDLSKILPSFDPVVGDEDINRQIDKVEEYMDMYGWDDLAISLVET